MRNEVKQPDRATEYDAESYKDKITKGEFMEDRIFKMKDVFYELIDYLTKDLIKDGNQKVIACIENLYSSFNSFEEEGV